MSQKDVRREVGLSLPVWAPGPDGCADGCCMSSAPNPVERQRRAVLSRRVRLLVSATITYNVIEAVVAISAGAVASSTALMGFGLDSVIEVSSAAAVAWQFSGGDPEVRERVALRVIAVSFFALAGYVTVESIRSLLAGGALNAPRPESFWPPCRWWSCHCCRMHSDVPGVS
jgi:hypothetical protein